MTCQEVHKVWTRIQGACHQHIGWFDDPCSETKMLFIL